MLSRKKESSPTSRSGRCFLVFSSKSLIPFTFRFRSQMIFLLLCIVGGQVFFCLFVFCHFWVAGWLSSIYGKDFLFPTDLQFHFVINLTALYNPQPASAPCPPNCIALNILIHAPYKPVWKSLWDISTAVLWGCARIYLDSDCCPEDCPSL